MLLFWLALAFCILATGASSIFVTKRGLELFRTTKKLTRQIGEDLDRISRASAAIEGHLTAAATSGTELEAALGRLRVSRAYLAVLGAALADVRASAGRITAVVPRGK